MIEHSTKHVQKSRFSISLLKWLAIVSLAGLPFSFSEGLADWRYLIVAPFAGAGWIMTLIYFWRTESILAAGLAFWVFIGLHHLSDNVYDRELPFAHFLQWLSAFLFVAVIPLVFRRQAILDYCGLDEREAEQPAPSGGEKPTN